MEMELTKVIFIYYLWIMSFITYVGNSFRLLYMSKHYQESNFDIAQLFHVEILSPMQEETITFFTRFLGL